MLVAQRKIKCVLVGDDAVGKTSLVISYTNNLLPGEYMPTVFDKITLKMNVNRRSSIELDLWDTAGQAVYDRQRLLCYQQINSILLCFSIASPSSLHNVRNKWHAELKRNCDTRTPIILVGTKLDLRDDPATIEKLRLKQMSPVSYQQGMDMMKDINAISYIGRLFFLVTIYYLYKN